MGMRVNLINTVRSVVVPRRKLTWWFTWLVVLVCLYVPLLLLLLYHRHFRFDYEGVRQKLHLIVSYPGLAVADYIWPVFGVAFYYVFETLSVVGAIWLARRSVNWLVGISIGALILSLFNIQEMLRWG